MTDKLIINSNKLILLVDFDKIIYFRSDNSYTNVQLVDTTRHLLCKSLAQIESEINSSQFIRIHQSYLINKEKITLIDKENKLIHMVNGNEIPYTLRLKDLLGSL